MNREQSIQSIKAFLPDEPDVESVIRYCDLHPTHDSWKMWTDNLGSFLKVYNNRKVTSFTNNPLSIEEKIVTDLYFKSLPQKIANISRRVFIAQGEDVCFGWFLGKDDRLRLVTHKDGAWTKNYPVMSCGIQSILPIVTLLNSTIRGRVDILNVRGPISASIHSSWVIDWPPSDIALHQIKDTQIVELC